MFPRTNLDAKLLYHSPHTLLSFSLCYIEIGGKKESKNTLLAVTFSSIAISHCLTPKIVSAKRDMTRPSSKELILVDETKNGVAITWWTYISIQ